MEAGRLEVYRGGDADLAYIMATARIAGFEEFVGRWEMAQHRAALADGRHAYFVARDDSQPIGFANPARLGLARAHRIAQAHRGQPSGHRIREGDAETA